jgi:hypothetical protein
LGFGGKEDKKEKEGSKDHEALANEAVAELEKTDEEEEAKDFEQLKKKKKAKGQEIEETYKPKLEQGVKLTVNFKGEKEGELDFEVVIAPNDTKKPVRIRLGDVKAALDEAGGIIEFMEAMANGKTIKKINIKRLNEIWTNTNQRDFLKQQFRQATGKYKHEWIPTNMIPHVIQRAASTKDLTGEGVAWIHLHNNLRSDTSWVVFKPALGINESYNGKMYKVLTGHSGALYIGNSPKTQGINNFHDELRKAFREGKSINECLTSLQAVFRKWIWKNESLKPEDIHPLLTWNDEPAAKNLSSLKARLDSAYADIDAMFENSKTKG